MSAPETEAALPIEFGIAVPMFHRRYEHQEPSHHQHIEGDGMQNGNGLNGRSVVPPSRKNTSHRDGKKENGDWLAAQVARRSVQEVVDSTGMTDKAVQNLRRGKSKISFDNLVDLCRDDPDFAAAFAAHIGLILPGEAAFAGALTRTFNEYSRMKATKQ